MGLGTLHQVAQLPRFGRLVPSGRDQRVQFHEQPLVLSIMDVVGVHVARWFKAPQRSNPASSNMLRNTLGIIGSCNSFILYAQLVRLQSMREG